MKMNMFSAFNPATSQSTSLLWISSITIMMMLPSKLWKPETKTLKTLEMMWTYLNNQFKTMMKKSSTINLIIMNSVLMMILMLNIMGMLPFTYPQTSQPQMTMSMAMPMWAGIMMTKMKTPNKLMAHMVPISTPPMLMPMMVMIETLSNVIQPITLSIRLMANITAGHILITLISMSHPKSWIMMMTMIAQMTMSTVELFVCFIQAYVFSMLLIMYTK